MYVNDAANCSENNGELPSVTAPASKCSEVAIITPEQQSERFTSRITVLPSASRQKVSVADMIKWCAEYFRQDFQGRSMATVRRNSHLLAAMFKWAHQERREWFDVKFLADFNIHIEAIGWASTTRVEMFRAINRYMSWLERDGKIDLSPHHAFRHRIRRVPKYRPPMSKEDYEKLRMASVGHYVRWILTLGWHTGMSIADCMSLRWHNVSMDKCFIHIERNKSGTEATIPFDPTDELGVELKRRYDDAASRGPIDPFDYVEPLAGRVFDRNAINKTFDYIASVAKSIGVNCRFHSIRKSFISALANSGMNTALASKISGHKDPKIFAHYVEPDIEAMREQLRAARAKRFSDGSTVVEIPHRKTAPDCETWRPLSVYRIRKPSVDFPMTDGSPAGYCATGPDASGKVATVTLCNEDGSIPEGSMRCVFDFGRVVPKSRVDRSL